MASGPVSRTDRPNTWLLRPALRRDRSLDNPEPSTHGPKRTLKHREPHRFREQGNTLSFNSSLMREMRAIAFITRMIDKGLRR